MTVKKTLQPWRPQAARHGRPPSANGTAAADAAAIVPGCGIPPDSPAHRVAVSARSPVSVSPYVHSAGPAPGLLSDISVARCCVMRCAPARWSAARSRGSSARREPGVSMCDAVLSWLRLTCVTPVLVTTVRMGSAWAGGGEPDHLLCLPHPRRALPALGAAAAAFSLWRPCGLGFTYVTCLVWSRKSEA